MEAYYNAIAQQDAQLASEAMQAGQAQTAFGADLYRLGGNLGNQMYGLQTAALGPYEAYLQQARQLEGLGQQPLDLGINIGAKGQSTASANALYGGGMAAAGSQFKADAYNPFATALTQGSQNKTFTDALSKLFNKPAVSGFDSRGYGAGVNPFSGEFMGSTEF
jgi:hypothetical protein